MLKIGNFGVGSLPFIVAEVGSNHCGSMKIAHEHITEAKKAGVHAVKFQLFTPEKIITPDAEILGHTGSKYKHQIDRFREVALSYANMMELSYHAKEEGLEFLCTPFDHEAVDFLDGIVSAFKIASGDANYYPLINDIVSRGKPVIASTGMCTQAEVDQLVALLPPEMSVLMHCIGSYPTSPADVNLRLIPFYKDRYKIPVGFSDHTASEVIPVMAICAGAVIIEKHFITDMSLPAGDKKLSLLPDQMARMIETINDLIIHIMGYGGPREVYPCEEKTRQSLRRAGYINSNEIKFLRPE